MLCSPRCWVFDICQVDWLHATIVCCGFLPLSTPWVSPYMELQVDAKSHWLVTCLTTFAEPKMWNWHGSAKTRPYAKPNKQQQEPTNDDNMVNGILLGHGVPFWLWQNQSTPRSNCQVAPAWSGHLYIKALEKYLAVQIWQWQKFHFTTPILTTS